MLPSRMNYIAATIGLVAGRTTPTLLAFSKVAKSAANLPNRKLAQVSGRMIPRPDPELVTSGSTNQTQLFLSLHASRDQNRTERWGSRHSRG
jgi:hypothetical protein